MPRSTAQDDADLPETDMLLRPDAALEKAVIHAMAATLPATVQTAGTCCHDLAAEFVRIEDYAEKQAGLLQRLMEANAPPESPEPLEKTEKEVRAPDNDPMAFMRCTLALSLEKSLLLRQGAVTMARSLQMVQERVTGLRALTADPSCIRLIGEMMVELERMGRKLDEISLSGRDEKNFYADLRKVEKMIAHEPERKRKMLEIAKEVADSSHAIGKACGKVAQYVQVLNGSMQAVGSVAAMASALDKKEMEKKRQATDLAAFFQETPGPEDVRQAFLDSLSGCGMPIKP